MQNFLNSLTEGAKVNILGKEYIALGCVDYTTFAHPDVKYTKVYFENHRMLVLAVTDNCVYFGEDIGTSIKNENFSEHISFKGNTYELQINEYQLVKCVRFGNAANLEGEVNYWDYININNNKQLLSISKISRTGCRSDVIAIEISDLDYKIV